MSPDNNDGNSCENEDRQILSLEKMREIEAQLPDGHKVTQLVSVGVTFPSIMATGNVENVHLDKKMVTVITVMATDGEMHTKLIDNCCWGHGMEICASVIGSGANTSKLENLIKQNKARFN